MKTIHKFTKYTPYLYFIAVIAFWFTSVNREKGLLAYPLLLFAIPFVWQLIKPSRRLNAILGITFACLSSYMVVAYLSDAFNIIRLSYAIKKYIIYSGLFVICNFFMATWMIRNTLNKQF